MNRKQLVALWIGIALFVLVGLFPPWIITTAVPDGTTDIKPHSPTFILNPPDPKAEGLHAIKDGWNEVLEDEPEEVREKLMMDNLIDASRSLGRIGWQVTIAFTQVVIGWILITVVTGGAILTLADRKRSNY